MAKFNSPLNNLKVASPCSQDWDAMLGDNRRRYCGECKLNVYNLSGMTRAEAESLIQKSEGRLCVRFYRRADGSVITEDCPVGWARVKSRVRAFTAAASLLFTFLGAVGLQSVIGRTESRVQNERIMGAMVRTDPKIAPNNPLVMGEMPVESANPKPMIELAAIPVVQEKKHKAAAKRK